MASNYAIDDEELEEDEDIMRLDDDILDADIEEDDIIEDENPRGSKKRKSSIGIIRHQPVAKQQQKQQQEKLPRAQNPAKTISDSKLDLGTKIDRICEFAHALMHCLLYKINYYDRKTHFNKALKYDIIVYKCKSEMVCEYINNCIECMRLLLYEKYNLDTDELGGEHKTELTTLNRGKKREKIEDTFSIGLAVLKVVPNGLLEDEEPINLLIRRYTLQIECLDDNIALGEQLNGDSILDEWNFRDSLLKCLYSNPSFQYPDNFKWQIQMRTNKSLVQKMNSKEDLFKLFAWRQCDNEEITSIKTRSSSYNPISIKPVKTMNHFNKMRVQLFIEQSIKNQTSK